jgi:hypothetical protein
MGSTYKIPKISAILEYLSQSHRKQDGAFLYLKINAKIWLWLLPEISE